MVVWNNGRYEGLALYAYYAVYLKTPFLEEIAGGLWNSRVTMKRIKAKNENYLKVTVMKILKMSHAKT